MDRHKLTYDKNKVEELCRLYMEGRLTLEEEKDLQRLLAHIEEENSDVVDETLFLMGISKAVSKSSAIPETVAIAAGSPQSLPRRRRLWGRLVKIGSAAAVVAVAFTVGWHFHKSESTAEGEVCEVYAFGEKITDKKKCREMAMESYRNSMGLIARMRQLEEEKMSVMENVSKMRKGVPQQQLQGSAAQF